MKYLIEVQKTGRDGGVETSYFLRWRKEKFGRVKLTITTESARVFDGMKAAEAEMEKISAYLRTRYAWAKVTPVPVGTEG